MSGNLPRMGLEAGEDGLVTLSEAAALIGVSKTTVWRALKNGRLSVAGVTAKGANLVDPTQLNRIFSGRKSWNFRKKMTREDTRAMFPNFHVAINSLFGLEGVLAATQAELEKAQVDADKWRAVALGLARAVVQGKLK